MVPYSTEYLADRLIRRGAPQGQKLYVKFNAREKCPPNDKLNVPTNQSYKGGSGSDDGSDVTHEDHPNVTHDVAQRQEPRRACTRR